MAQKAGVKAALIVLLALAGVVVLIAWFAWSFKTQKNVPTSPKSTSRLEEPWGTAATSRSEVAGFRISG